MKHHISRALEPIQSFFRHEAFSGLLLLFFAALAIILANSPLSGSYQAVLDAVPIAGPAAYHLDLSVLHWVNDGLMAIFFFVIGLEIKREFFFGELQSLSATVLPVCAAVGGMLVPALLYAAVNMGGAPAAMAGWGIPMATDIAFSLGILSVAARSAPLAIVIFLTALAIVDDLGAIIVIALFYTGSFSLIALLAGLAALAAAFALNRRGVLHIAPYLLLGLLAWFCFLNAGIHPTIAGVILAFAIPIDRTHPESSLLYALEHRLEPWSAYVIMPVFALANAGVVLPGNLAALTEPVALGIVVGLCIGKPLGVCGLPTEQLPASAAAEGAQRRSFRGRGLSRRHRLYHVALHCRTRLPRSRPPRHGKTRHHHGIRAVRRSRRRDLPHRRANPRRRSII